MTTINAETAEHAERLLLCEFCEFRVDRCSAQSTKDRAEEGFEAVEVRLRAQVASRVDHGAGRVPAGVTRIDARE